MAKKVLDVLIARRIDNTWQKVAVGQHWPGVGTRFPLECPKTHLQIESSIEWMRQEPECNWVELHGKDGHYYRVGPFL